jgi:hypothetical protein
MNFVLMMEKYKKQDPNRLREMVSNKELMVIDGKILMRWILNSQLA